MDRKGLDLALVVPVAVESVSRPRESEPGHRGGSGEYVVELLHSNNNN